MSTVTREQLYAEVWAQPMTTVAQKYEVSSNYLARICERLKVPRPPRGYWQQRAVGRADDQAPLGEPEPGDDLVWSRGTEASFKPAPTPRYSADAIGRVRRPQRPKTHPLLVGVRDEFEDSTPARFSDDGYLKPKSHALPHVYVSHGSLRVALDVTNKLYLFLEDRGHWVRSAPQGVVYRRRDIDHREGASRGNYDSSRIWTPGRPTLVFIGGVAIGLALFEIAELGDAVYEDGRYVRAPKTAAFERLKAADPWRAHQTFLPSGRLGLLAYSPYPGSDWNKYWREAARGDLPGRFEEIAGELERAAPVIADRVQESERQAQERHRQYELAEQRRRAEEIAKAHAQADAESRQHLLSVVDHWVLACNVEQFLQSLTDAREGLSHDEQAQLDDRVETARRLFRSTTALQHFADWRTPDEHFSEIARQPFRFR